MALRHTASVEVHDRPERALELYDRILPLVPVGSAAPMSPVGAVVAHE